MTAYVVMIRDRLVDAGAMAEYARLAPRAREQTPAKPLAFYGALEVLEGPDADGVVILAFDDMAAAHRWYGSDAYQEALPHRLRGAEYRVLLVNGVSEAD